MGLIGPITMHGKLLIQKLWLLNVGWNATVSTEVRKEWALFCEQIKLLNKICIQRKAATLDDHYSEYHGFCDASIRAYEACIYVKEVNNDGDVTCNLL